VLEGDSPQPAMLPDHYSHATAQPKDTNNKEMHTSFLSISSLNAMVSSCNFSAKGISTCWLLL